MNENETENPMPDSTEMEAAGEAFDRASEEYWHYRNSGKPIPAEVRAEYHRTRDEMHRIHNAECEARGIKTVRMI